MTYGRLSSLVVAVGLLLAIASVSTASLTYYGSEPSDSSLMLYNMAFSLAVAIGVQSDRRTQSFGAPYEYGAFMFFLWPVLLPVYLFRTRRWRGLAAAFGVFLLAEVPVFAAIASYYWLSASVA